jgi:hypothetical protein
VPTQSDAVSPPPTTTTCWPDATIGSDGQADDWIGSPPSPGMPAARGVSEPPQ